MIVAFFTERKFMRITAIILLMCVILISQAFASIIDFKDGRTIQGKIISQDSKSIQIIVDGVTMTYYADEILDVDGKTFGVPTPAPQAETVTSPPTMATSQENANPNYVPSSISLSGMIDPAKKALILKFIDVFGTRQALNNNFERMIDQIAKEKPEEAIKIRERVKIDEIIDRLLPIYDRNFSTDDLNALIAFYGSPVGQKLMTTIPILMKESILESVKYMEEKFPEAVQGQQ